MDEPVADGSEPGAGGTDDSRPPDGDREGTRSDDDSRGDSRPADGASESPLPDDVVAEAERLTRLARNATDPDERAAYADRREKLVADYGYTTRVREADDTLICHPDRWVEDGVVRTERIDDLSAATEISLSGPGDPDDWATLDADNRELVDRVREEAGGVHAANAEVFADFMGNHCAKPMTAASAEEIERFLGEYYVRNAWPDPGERAVIVESIETVFDVAGVEHPAFSSPEPPSPER